MVSIDGDYQVLVSDQLVEDEGHPYSLEQLRGLQVYLPMEKKYYPSPEIPEWYREKE
ncbi:hypothetical protein [Anditalea andensis]|uniref:hypothetical protein n=1 Tax=Anditalea andensis TaxID=1048983 RepID=UPI0013DF43D2|nr:hypothetical protein [Anditalea andensis]